MFGVSGICFEVTPTAQQRRYGFFRERSESKDMTYLPPKIADHSDSEVAYRYKIQG
ncbi:MAG: hypothetical protein ACI8YQ_003935 [Polaribacter sp.]|jgi:hypothetical protein